MAMHTVAENIGDVTEQHLAREDLPKRYLWRIWRLLENRFVPPEITYLPRLVCI